MTDADLLNLTTSIVSSYVAGNTLPPEQLGKLICDTHNALGTLTLPTPNKSDQETPVVSVKKSVFNDHIVCLCCGREAKMLKRHIMTEHSLTVDQYRAKWGLPESYPMTAPGYSERRSALAKENGLGRGPNWRG